MRRFLLHVLPGGFHRIRHYGLLANGSRKANLALARELLHVAPPPPDAAAGDAVGPRRAPTFVCRHCGHAMVVLQTFMRDCRSGRRRHHDRARITADHSTLDAASGGLLRAPLAQRSATPLLPAAAASKLARRMGAAVVGCGRWRVARCQLATPAQTNRHSRCARQPPWRSPRFPPSRLMQHLPAGSEVRDRLRAGQVSHNLNSIARPARQTSDNP